MNILLLDRDKARRDDLAEQLRTTLPGCALAFEEIEQHDVFGTLPETPCAAAFIWIGGMLDLEAARQLTRASPGLPVVIVSDSGEYSIESYHIGILRHYLLYPVDNAALHQALVWCGLL